MDIKAIKDNLVWLAEKANAIWPLVDRYETGIRDGFVDASTTKAAIFAKAKVLMVELDAIYKALIDARK